MAKKESETKVQTKTINEKPKLNKFEMTRLLSARALELSKGDKPKVDIDEKMMLSNDYVKIAQKEYEEDALDLEIYK